MDVYRGENTGDCPDSHRSSSSATSSWPSDESVSNLHRPNFAADGYQQQQQHQQQEQHHRHEHRNRHFHPRDDNHHHQSDYNQNYNSENNDFFGSGIDSNSDHSAPLSGRKRQFFHHHHAAPPDGIGSCGFAKLFVLGIPRGATEEDIRPVFGEFGHVAEIVHVMDKKTGQQADYCFVKYSRTEEADRAIAALNGQYVFPGVMMPLKVRYADKEKERLGNLSEQFRKVYVGCLNKQAQKSEIAEIFSPFGVVEEVFVLRDGQKQHRGSAFVKFADREMAFAAINALHGTYVMRGCNQPLIVRFADPKKPRLGEFRSAPHVTEPPAGFGLPNKPIPISPKQTLATGSKLPADHSACGRLTQLLPSTANFIDAGSTVTETADSVDCDWSEHVCPDGYTYYYNCITCESRWEKPDEYAHYEQEVEKMEQEQQQHQQNLRPEQVQRSIYVQ